MGLILNFCLVYSFYLKFSKLIGIKFNYSKVGGYFLLLFHNDICLTGFWIDFFLKPCTSFGSKSVILSYEGKNEKKRTEKKTLVLQVLY